MKRFVKVCCNCFISLMIVVFIVLLFVSFSSKKDGLAKIGKYSLLDVNGDSMYPKIKDGDYIAIYRKIKDVYEIGDIVSFVLETDEGNLLVTHKIVDVKEYGNTYMYTTKGINNEINDEKTILNEEIIGEYKNFRIPLLGYVVRFSRTNIGYLLLVVLPLGLVLLFATYELIKEIGIKKGEA